MTKPFPVVDSVNAVAVLEAAFPSDNLSQVKPALPVMDRLSLPLESEVNFPSILAVRLTTPVKGRKLIRLAAPAPALSQGAVE